MFDPSLTEDEGRRTAVIRLSSADRRPTKPDRQSGSLAYAATASASCGCSTCLTSSSSMLIVIWSPTSQPPVSSATFQFKFQSLRLILVLALKPALVVPQGVLAWPAYSTSSVTEWVTSRMVRSPISLPCESSICSTLVLLNVRYGNCSTSRKS